MDLGERKKETKLANKERKKEATGTSQRRTNKGNKTQAQQNARLPILLVIRLGC